MYVHKCSGTYMINVLTNYMCVFMYTYMHTYTYTGRERTHTCTCARTVTNISVNSIFYFPVENKTKNSVNLSFSFWQRTKLISALILSFFFVENKTKNRVNFIILPLAENKININITSTCSLSCREQKLVSALILSSTFFYTTKLTVTRHVSTRA
jgi:hypothetical protein